MQLPSHCKNYSISQKHFILNSIDVAIAQEGISKLFALDMALKENSNINKNHKNHYQEQINDELSFHQHKSTLSILSMQCQSIMARSWSGKNIQQEDTSCRGNQMRLRRTQRYPDKVAWEELYFVKNLHAKLVWATQLESFMINLFHLLCWETKTQRERNYLMHAAIVTTWNKFLL